MVVDMETPSSCYKCDFIDLQARQNDMESCVICGKSFTKRSGNLQRHLLHIHEVQTEAKPRGRRPKPGNLGKTKSLSISALPSTKEKINVGSTDGRSRSGAKPTSHIHGDLDPAVSLTVSVAVQEILEQHDTYDMYSLCQLIGVRHAEIPDFAIPYIW